MQTSESYLIISPVSFNDVSEWFDHVDHLLQALRRVVRDCLFERRDGNISSMRAFNINLSVCRRPQIIVLIVIVNLVIVIIVILSESQMFILNNEI